MRRLIAICALGLTACGGTAGTTSEPPRGSLPILDITTTTTTPMTVAQTTTTTTTPPAHVSRIIATRTGIAGWWDGEAWVSAEVTAPPLQIDSEYQFIYLNDPITVQAAGTIAIDTEGICATPDSGLTFPPVIRLTPDLIAFPQPRPIAISADWDIRPHGIELLDVNNPTYQEEVRKLLAETEAETEEVDLVQVIRTDLEGDGVNEVIVTAERISDQSLIANKQGEYSIVFLRKVIESEAQTAILGHHVIEQAQGGLQPSYVTAIADLNGDGKMEIVMDSFHYEGSSTTILEYVNNELGAVPALSAGCNKPTSHL